MESWENPKVLPMWEGRDAPEPRRATTQALQGVAEPCYPVLGRRTPNLRHNAASKQEAMSRMLERGEAAERRPRGRSGYTRVVPLLPALHTHNLPEKTEQERFDSAYAAIAQAFRMARTRQEDLEPYRIPVAHRITREILRFLGVCAPDMRLTEAMIPSRNISDPWREPQPYSGWDQNPAHLEIMECFEEALIDLKLPGLPILPPEAPETPNYKTREDKYLRLYVKLIEATQRSLNIEQGMAPGRPEMGRLGLSALIDRDLVRQHFPSPYEIMAWEEILIQETLDVMVQRGQNKTAKHLQHAYGMLPHETAGWIKLAKIQARELTENDVEDDRAYMILRLDNYIERCREAVDLAAEHRALKHMSVILGLGKVDPEDANAEFLKVVRKLDRLEDGGDPGPATKQITAR